ncbi:MAG: RluA family pseudouridine synthase, partial [Candidatus Chaera renei]
DLPKPPDFTGRSLPVIFKNESVVVINKPSGILTHAKGAPCDEFTVAEFVRLLTADTNGNRPGIVHRLDRGTSGVIICALNESAHKFLQRQFSQRKVKKNYLARLCRQPRLASARLELPIKRNPKRPQTFSVSAGGRPSVTEYKLLKSFADDSYLVRLTPLTGRTHQLRVHMAYIGSPICGDSLYGDAGCHHAKPPERMMLHASSLEITVPTKKGNQRMVFRTDTPPGFEA